MSVRRGPITVFLRDLFRGTEVAVETITLEDTASLGKVGWSKTYGTPGSEYTPYAILIPQTAARHHMVTVGGQDPWDLPYVLTGFGVDINQVEDIMDDFRSLSGPFTRHTRQSFGEKEVWTTTNLTCTSIGGVGWNNQVQPPMYSQSDSYTITVSKE